MIIQNARINIKRFGFDERGDLSVAVQFNGQSSHGRDFVITNSIETLKLCALMRYAGVSEFNDLDGKIIRIVEDEPFLEAIGDPIEDKFVLLVSEGYKEITEFEMKSLLK